MTGLIANRLQGQMAVELVTVMPVALAIAVICVNAMNFFSVCAAFDIQFREAVRVYAASPAAAQAADSSVALVEAELERRCCSSEVVACSVGASCTSLGHWRFDATLSYTPNLFGLGLKSEVFGVSLPRLKHRCSFTVDSYKPGILL